MVSHPSHSLIGFCGFLASFFLFLSPAIIFRSIIGEGSVQGYAFLPYPMAFLNCMIWLCYGKVLADSDYVIVINSLGMVIEAIFVVIYIWYSDVMVRRDAVMVLMGLGLLGVLVLLLGFVWRHTVFGYTGVVSGILMYGAPLSITKRVMETGSVQNLSLLSAIASFSTTTLWTAYAFTSTPYDLYIAIPNVLGWALALAQLILYAYYYFNGDEAVVA